MDVQGRPKGQGPARAGRVSTAHGEALPGLQCSGRGTGSGPAPLPAAELSKRLWPSGPTVGRLTSRWARTPGAPAGRHAGSRTRSPVPGTWQPLLQDPGARPSAGHQDALQHQSGRRRPTRQKKPRCYASGFGAPGTASPALSMAQAAGVDGAPDPEPSRGLAPGRAFRPLASWLWVSCLPL